MQNPEKARFVPSGWRDAWAAVLFMGQIAAVISLAIYSFSSRSYNSAYPWMRKNDSPGSRLDTSIPPGTTDPCSIPWHSDDTNKALVVLSASITAAGFLGMLWLTLMCEYALRFLSVLIYVNVLITGALVLFTLFTAGPLFVLFPLLGFIIFAIVMCSVRHRIPFSALCLTQAAGTVRRHWTIIGVSVFCLLLSMGYLCLWFFATTVTTQAWQLAPLVLCWLWTQEVLTNIAHTTTAGVAATDYFAGTCTQRPVWGAFRRATTTSLGSVCLGSLLVAAVRLVRYTLTELRLRAQVGGDITVFCLCCVECLLGWIESLVQYFNHYAYVYVAIYGKSFREAAHATWALVKTAGVDAILNDLVVGTGISMAAFIGSLVVGLGAGVWMWLWYRNVWPCDGATNYGIVWGLGAALITYFIHSLFFSVIDSALITFFVCYAEEPQILYSNNPELFRQIREKQAAGGIVAGLEDPFSRAGAPTQYGTPVGPYGAPQFSQVQTGTMSGSQSPPYVPSYQTYSPR